MVQFGQVMSALAVVQLSTAVSTKQHSVLSNTIARVTYRTKTSLGFGAITSTVMAQSL